MPAMRRLDLGHATERNPHLAPGCAPHCQARFRSLGQIERASRITGQAHRRAWEYTVADFCRLAIGSFAAVLIEPNTLHPLHSAI